MPAEKTIDEMLMSLPKTELVMVKRLRALVQECLPAATEKGYYGEGVMFYTHHRMICFIWPASVFWGAAKEKSKMKGVTLGFCQGNLMSNEDGTLQSEGRKQTYTIHFNTLPEISDDKVRAWLFEAGMIDDQFGERKKNKVRKKK
jgi:hypothetical protein